MDIYMPFGRHRGTALSQVPEDYLHWVCTIELQSWLRTAIEAELETRIQARADERARYEQERAKERDEQERQQRQASVRPCDACPDAGLADLIVSAGLHKLARQAHPDAGGTHETMVKLNNVADWLRACARGDCR